MVILRIYFFLSPLSEEQTSIKCLVKPVLLDFLELAVLLCLANLAVKLVVKPM